MVRPVRPLLRVVRRTFTVAFQPSGSSRPVWQGKAVRAWHDGHAREAQRAAESGEPPAVRGLAFGTLLSHVGLQVAQSCFR